MLGKMRYIADKPPGFGGLLVNADGSTQYLTPDMFTIESISTWTSPHTGATYPSGWNISVNTGDTDPLQLSLTIRSFTAAGSPTGRDRCGSRAMPLATVTLN
jgi:predicted secreted hydrolase